MGKHLRHPDAKAAEIQRLVEEKRTETGMPSGWSWPWGWWIKLWETNGTTHLRHLPPGASYHDAARVRDEEMRSGRYEKSWMGQKTRPTQEAK